MFGVNMSLPNRAFHLGVNPVGSRRPATMSASPHRADLESGERRLEALRWGLIPFWAKDAKIAYSTIKRHGRDGGDEAGDHLARVHS